MAEVDLIIKLFDVLTESSKETRKGIQAVLTNQNDIGNYIKTLPLNDVKETIKDHNNTASDKITTCTDSVYATSDKILERVEVLRGKVIMMVTIVLVTFAVFTSAVFIARFTITPPIEHLDLKETIIELKSTLEKDKKQQAKLIEELRESIKELQAQ